MAKLLVVGSTGEITDANENDVIAIYEDSQELGKKEIEHIESGRFKLVIIDDTIETVRTSMQESHPEIKECWYDAESETWKDLKSTPRFTINYSDGFSHNYKVDTENDVEVNKTKIESLESELAATKTAKVTKG